jgi:hypothetical protein
LAPGRTHPTPKRLSRELRELRENNNQTGKRQQHNNKRLRENDEEISLSSLLLFLCCFRVIRGTLFFCRLRDF